MRHDALGGWRAKKAALTDLRMLESAFIDLSHPPPASPHLILITTQRDNLLDIVMLCNPLNWQFSQQSFSKRHLWTDSPLTRNTAICHRERWTDSPWSMREWKPPCMNVRLINVRVSECETAPKWFWRMPRCFCSLQSTDSTSSTGWWGPQGIPKNIRSWGWVF